LEARDESTGVCRVLTWIRVLRGSGLALLGLAAAVAAHMAVEPGMARVNVLQELGRPASAVARGNTEILTYAGGVKITLRDGRVTEVKGLQPAASAPVADAAAPAPPAEAATPEAAAEEDEPALNPAQSAALAQLEKQLADEQAQGRAELENAITQLEDLHHRPAAAPVQPKFDAAGFVLGLVLKWLLTLAALKLTCKYWGCEVFWSGLMTVAAVDVTIRAGIGLIFALLLGLPTFYADEAIAAIVMVLVLRKVSINQSLAQAVQITMTTKLFSIVVGSLVLVAVLQALR
jgi:hypothetical protein